MTLERLWVGTADGVGRAGDPALGARALKGHAVRGLASSNGALWAILDARTVVRSVDGLDWSEVVAFDDVRVHCLLPEADAVWIGTSDAHLYRLPGQGTPEVVAGFERVPGRVRWYTPWGAPADVRSLSRGGNGTLYVNVHVGGVVRSRDLGRTWEQTMDIDADAHQVLAHPSGGRTVVAATAQGLAVSFAAGEDWTFVTEGLHATYLRAAAFARGTVLVSASRGDNGEDAALYRTTWPELGPLVRCERGLPRWFENNINTGCLVADGELVACATTDGRIFLSLDRGESFEQIQAGLPPIKCLALSP